MKTKTFIFRENVNIFQFDDETNQGCFFTTTGIFHRFLTNSRQGLILPCKKEEALDLLIEMQKKENYRIREHDYWLKGEEAIPFYKEEWEWELNRAKYSGDLEPEDYDRTIDFLKKKIEKASDFIDDIVVDFD